MNGFVNGIFNGSARSITSAAFILASSALLSRVLGVLRDRILAGKFGAGDELDMYYAAFRIPDTIYSIIIMGAISSVFIPVFSEYLVKNKDEAWDFVSNLLTLIFLILTILSLIFILFTPFLLQFIAPGFEGEKRELTIFLTRLMFVSPLLFGIGSVFGGVLQGFRRFLAYGLAPIFYNLGIIFGAVVLTGVAPRFGYPAVVGLTWGVLLGALLQLLIQVPGTISLGFQYHFFVNFAHQGIQKVVKLAIPRIIGLAAYHTNLIVITALASTLSAGSIAVFNFANNLQYFPIGIIGISFATAAFPELSRRFVKNELEAFRRTFSSTFRTIFFLVFPIGVFTLLFRAQIVRLILGTGQFSWEDTRLTAASLGIFALSIFAQAQIPLLSKSFYSFHDTRTPVIISMVSIASNIVLSFLFLWAFSFSSAFSAVIKHLFDVADLGTVSVIGLPLAFSLASILNFILLFLVLYKRLGVFNMAEIVGSGAKTVLASVLSGVIAHNVLIVSSIFFDTTRFMGVFFWTVLAFSSGVIAFVFLSWLLKSPELFTIIGILRIMVRRVFSIK